jgi:hypothetical protein
MEEYIFNSEFFCLIFFSARSLQNTQGPIGPGQWKIGLNLVTTPDKYPLPNMQDLSSGLHDCTIFSKIDLVKGYHQIPVAAEDIPKTAIITQFGLFVYKLLFISQ